MNQDEKILQLPIRPSVSGVSKSHYVRQLFENAPRYLDGRRYDIRIRAETIQEFADTIPYNRVLDIGCGDGSISLPLAKNERQLTLLDMSSTMIDLARRQITPDMRDNVEVRNENFMAVPFRPSSFDLVLCIGVMAHVDSPDQLLAKIAKLLAPGGHLILEFTDVYHMASLPSRLLRATREFIKPPSYHLNPFSYEKVAGLIAKNGFRSISQFRYGLPWLPGIRLSQDSRYKLVRRIFGNLRNNRNCWLGNEYVCLLTLDGKQGCRGRETSAE